MSVTRRLIITADDYGYSSVFNEGILEAAQAGAIDAVAVMVEGVAYSAANLGDLASTGVEIGLHLDLDCSYDDPWADDRDRSVSSERLRSQLARLTTDLGRPPAFLNGHHHCHARSGLGVLIADAAGSAGLAVRSIDPRQRRLLECRGIPTPGLLIGRLSESDPALPAELRQIGQAVSQDRSLPAVTEWMVHPGHPDPGNESTYNRGRGEDLKLLLGMEMPPGIERATHAQALSQAR